MKAKIAIAFACAFLIFSCKISAQLKGIDENGKAVLLFSNGTWRYDVDSTNSNTPLSDSIINNYTIFSKSPNANFLIKSNVLNVGVYFNTDKWSVKTHADNEVMPEYKFTLKSEDAFAMLIAEKTPIDLQDMRDIALMNAQKAAADAKIVSSEYRTVNGLKILCMKFTGTIKGIMFEYFGYYYSNENGTVQLLTYTSQHLFATAYNEMENFLNGLVEVQK